MTRTKWLILAGLLLLQALDLMSTKLVFAHGGRELNPAVLAVGGIWPAKLIGVVLSLAIALACSRPRHVRIACAVAVAYAAVVGWNLSLLAR